MQLASRYAFPEPPLAAMWQLSENSRLGFRLAGSTLQQGFGAGKYLIGIGDTASVVRYAWLESLKAQQQVSQQGQDFIKGYESLSLTVYDASKGKVKGGDWTIGYGHKTTKGAGAITLPEAEALFQSDVARMASHVSADLNVSVSQNQFDALVSLRFNAGANAITPPVSDLNSTGHATMGDFTNHYITGGGVPMRGLELRRAAEWRIFSEGVYDASH